MLKWFILTGVRSFGRPSSTVIRGSRPFGMFILTGQLLERDACDRANDG